MELVFDWHKASLLWNTKYHLIKVSKCKFMLLGHSSHLGDFSSLSLSISGEDLERVDCYKYFGFTLNQRLSWEDHVSNIASKIRKRISILSRIKYMLPLSAGLTFYNTMINPIFKYNSIVWGHKRNTVHMDTLQILQNRAAKIILGRDLRDSATQALKDLNWLTLVKKRTIDRCTFVYKCLNNLIKFDFDFK